MATMKQIAEIAGVSRGTVDRVLNGRGSVNEHTAAKIREIAQSLNYVPSKAARSLAARKLGLKLGYILFPYASNAFFQQVEDGIHKKEAELADFGVTVEIVYADFNNPRRQDELLEELAQKGVRGIALCGFNTPETAANIHRLAQNGIPVVTSNTDIPNSGRIAYVGSDYEKSGSTAGGLMRLITGDKARVSILLGSKKILCHTERVRGFISNLKEQRSSIEIARIIENGDDDFESFSLVKEMLAQDPQINALFLASAGVYGACRAVEALPPERRPKIISFDCVPTTKEMLNKGIITATICQQPERQGSKPLDLLFNYLAMGFPPKQEFFFTDIDIIIRESL